MLSNDSLGAEWSMSEVGTPPSNNSEKPHALVSGIQQQKPLEQFTVLLQFDILNAPGDVSDINNVYIGSGRVIFFVSPSSDFSSDMENL